MTEGGERSGQNHLTDVPRDWLHFIISLLCHGIGYVRGICQGDSAP